MSLLFAILQFFIPRNRDIWLYAEGQQRSCSHFLVQSKGLDSRRHVYISNNSVQATNLDKLGIETCAASSLKAKWLSIRAGVWVICTTRPNELNHRLSAGVKRFNIWHGMPIKAIALENYNPKTWKKSEFKRRRNLRRQTKKYQRVSFLCATSPMSQALYCKSFAKPPSEMPIVGEPRNDYLIKHRGNRNNLIERYGHGFKTAAKVFVYMPTFRDYGKWETKLDLFRLNQFLADNNAMLLIRAHPSDQSLNDLGTDYSHIVKSRPQSGSWDDAYEELVGADVLITDYSSLLFEYLLTSQPILLYHPDREKYENNRHFGLDFEQVKPSESITEFDDLLNAMSSCLDGSFDTTLLERSKALIHSVTDDKSSERVHAAICEQLSTNP
ncbi:CDP-glycerol glycerophosphotransferase family protein [Umboniibacter marinipuniceus]|uniref:CDP-glycerol glycerophosphotransferase (TagB/SpsB family) n=1 Tax=Umboniibacter marinipuniceus TaxID=569599 RepID=A0A3M0A5U9_9GAMM|nr:CDP-glycerol glycerophosphotransferase family protein [Umboniibacter marinipuniceus]RMA80150.1 CDP-glycerol glycerophosphotransferase (TagB/SpsB family) [Umboniibacter marinipuniceus]